MNGWKPIETAPRDGSMILAFNSAHRDMHVVGWTRAGANEPIDEDHWSNIGGQNKCPSLWFNENFFQFWMPLPPAPDSQ